MKKKNLYIPVVIASAILLPTTALAAEITVSKGDTLYSIAKKSSTTVDAIKKLNGLTSDTLYIGQKLKTSSENYATVVNAQLLNVRSGPGTSYAVLTTVRGGEQVKVIGASSTWKKVEVNGKTGYVSDYYLQATQVKAQAATEYIGAVSGLFKTPGKDKVSSLSPQRVTVLERGSDGWLKINTWLGPLWIKNGVTQEVSKIDYMYITKTSGVFKSPGKDKVSSLAPQRVIALERGADGWVKIDTWLGQMWIKDGVTVEPAQINYAYITKTSGLFKGQGKDKVSVLSPQRVVVLETGVHGWLKINTWLGPLWVNDGITAEETPTVTTPVSQIVYTVVSGDTLSKIAQKYNTTVTAVQNLNALKSANDIKIGQKLKIPTAGVIASAKIFSMPVEGSYQKTSDFGPRWGTNHYGTDFSRWGDVKILAAENGVVSKSESHATYGEVIYIKHVIDGKSYETLYAHLRANSRAVKVGDTVKTGQFIGWMGSTGNSTGQHLHFEVHLGQYSYGKGTAVDPLLYLK